MAQAMNMTKLLAHDLQEELRMICVTSTCSRNRSESNLRIQKNAPLHERFHLPDQKVSLCPLGLDKTSGERRVTIAVHAWIEREEGDHAALFS